MFNVRSESQLKVRTKDSKGVGIGELRKFAVTTRKKSLKAVVFKRSEVCRSSQCCFRSNRPRKLCQLYR